MLAAFPGRVIFRPRLPHVGVGAKAAPIQNHSREETTMLTFLAIFLADVAGKLAANHNRTRLRA